MDETCQVRMHGACDDPVHGPTRMCLKHLQEYEKKLESLLVRLKEQTLQTELELLWVRESLLQGVDETK